MTGIDNNADLQELREQYKLIGEKLDDDNMHGAIVKSGYISMRMMRNNSKMGKQYKKEIILSMMFIPFAFLGIILELPWWFILIVGILVGLKLVLDLKAYRMVRDRKKLLGSSMYEACKSLAESKKWRIKSYKILALPVLALILSGIYIGGISFAIAIIFALIGIFVRERRRMKELNRILELIEKMKW